MHELCNAGLSEVLKSFLNQQTDFIPIQIFFALSSLFLIKQNLLLYPDIFDQIIGVDLI